MFSMIAMDAKGLSQEEIDEVMSEFGDFEKTDTYNGWDVYSSEASGVLLHVEDNAYLIAYTLGDLDNTKAAVDKISNISLQ